MQAALRPCPRCHTLSRGPCARCRRQQDRARGTARERGYSPAWDTYSREWLARYPYCGQRLGGSFHPDHSACVRNRQIVPAAVTDHIVSLRDGGAKFDPLNHQSLCTSCNTAKEYART